ncbi:MAG TPA: FkbM family methyltransferase [Puia sp.]|nr:FkbM family methyltransferase [Puia sp.]
MPVRSILRRAKSIFEKNPNAVFKNVKGVIHVGANTGQEIGLYDRYGLSVVWVEPIPEVFETLKSNLAGFPRQIAIKSLVTDLENAEYQFHLANNNGASSSILDLNLHQDIWPDIVFERTITLRSRTLPSLLKDNNIDNRNYDMLVMDTQGSELLVLKGAEPILQDFKYIKTEVPDFESYKGCCQVKDLQLFLGQQGFGEYSRHQFAKRSAGGNYYDIIYKKM